MSQAKYKGYFKIVAPRPGITTMSDSQSIGDQGAYSNHTWYQRLVQGAATRLNRYREYDIMDDDVEIARSLDTIAEEMIGSDPESDLPLELVIDSEKDVNITSSMATTLKAALKYWNDIHDWNNRLFKVARVTIKYGDCFFVRRSDTKKWEYVHPKSVVCAIVDERDMTRVIGWQMRREQKTPNNTANQTVGSSGNYSNELVDQFAAEDVVWFSLNDDISMEAPFGESVLRAVFRAQKQKELLEDAIIIYRIQRAPERRVFYVDVGNMPPQRVKTYLEQIKNEIRQRKIPTAGGGVEQVDSVYNPQQMCLALDTMIPLLDGRTVSLQTMIEEHDAGKQNWTYSVDPLTGNIAPGIVSWAGVTQKNVETIKLTLDNGDVIVCTPEHKFPTQGHGKVEAKDLTPEHSLFPFNTKKKLIREDGPGQQYTQVYNPATKGWQFVHRLVANYMDECGEGATFVHNPDSIDSEKRTIHHKNFVATDNHPNNLVWMNGADHSAYHFWLSRNQQAVFSVHLISRFKQLVDKDIHMSFADMMSLLNSDSVFMETYSSDNLKDENLKFKLKTTEFRQKMFLVFIKTMGFENWKSYQQHIIQQRIDGGAVVKSLKIHDADDIALIQHLIHLVKNVTVRNFALCTYLNDTPAEMSKFSDLYHKCGMKRNTSKPGSYQTMTTAEASLFERISKYFGYQSFDNFVKMSSSFNHRVVKIEKWVNQDVGTLTIDQGNKYHNYHTFALTSCFTHNSEDFFFAQRPDGRGSKVETLPGGSGLGELADLEYFQWKVFRGLRIPLSYMREGSEGSTISDGKSGVAYIAELRFAMYVKRLQGPIERVLDIEFKRYLRAAGISIDPTTFHIKLNEPENFGTYRQQQLNNDLLNTYAAAANVPEISKRMGLIKYANWTDEEILRNYRMRCEELGIDPDGDQKANMRAVYGPAPDGSGGGMDAGPAGSGMVAGGGFNPNEAPLPPVGDGNSETPPPLAP